MPAPWPAAHAARPGPAPLRVADRLCKKGRAMTEACFQAGALAFADNVTTIRYGDGTTRRALSRGATPRDPAGCALAAAAAHTSPILASERSDFTIPAVDVDGDAVVPKGSTWRRDPIPACACDSGLDCRHASTGRGQSLKWLEAFFVPYSNRTDGVRTPHSYPPRASRLAMASPAH